MFAFLTSDNDAYENVLVWKHFFVWKIFHTLEIFLVLFQNERGVAVEDRVAFACCFLSDARLCEYLKLLSTNLCEEGNLAGLLITGMKNS